MRLKVADLKELGVSNVTAWRKISSGEWQSFEVGKSRNGKPIREVLLESLPHELQLRWVHLNKPEIDGAESSLTTDCDDAETRLTDALMRYEPTERDAFQAEGVRLLKIVHRYNGIKIKRIKNILTGKYDFTDEVLKLCREAICTDAAILKIEPARGLMPSPHTLDGWARRAETDGLLTFIRAKAATPTKTDKRLATFSPEAVEWVERNFRRFPSPSHLYAALHKQAKKHDWTIPSESYFYRKYSEMPKVVSTILFKTDKEYQSKLAPYVPRDYSDLEALQVLCGDHSVRDVSVIMPDGNLGRAWLTLWLCLRTYTLWGWHLDVTPSSRTIGLAYANGCRNFGAQPLARPDANFYSYLYTDWGKDYRCLDLNGRTLTFKNAAEIDGGLQIITMQRRVGLMDELGLKHLLARAYNAKEKPVERVHKDISAWEENTFPDEYCGRDKNKPDRWRDNWHRHERLKKKFGRDIPLLMQESPFMDFDSYRENLVGWIHQHNTTAHKRTVLGGRTIIPVDELERNYSRVTVSEEAMALLLMKATKKTITKNGVSMFQNWHFLHEEMSEHKTQEVEIRYSDDDYTHVWVILPATDRKPRRIVRAEKVTPTALLNPNKETLATIAKQGKHELKLARDFTLLNQSLIRGESTEDRYARAQQQADEQAKPQEIELRKTGTDGGGNVYQMTKFDAPKIVGSGKQVSAEQVEKAEIVDIFRTENKKRIKDEWED